MGIEQMDADLKQIIDNYIDTLRQANEGLKFEITACVERHGELEVSQTMVDGLLFSHKQYLAKQMKELG